jgi:hypothetical protein
MGPSDYYVRQVSGAFHLAIELLWQRQFMALRVRAPGSYASASCETDAIALRIATRGAGACYEVRWS